MDENPLLERLIDDAEAEGYMFLTDQVMINVVLAMMKAVMVMGGFGYRGCGMGNEMEDRGVRRGYACLKSCLVISFHSQLLDSVVVCLMGN